MQALEDGKTRFALAKERLGAVVGDLGSAGQVDLYLTTPRLAKFNRAALTPSQAVAAAKSLSAYDIGDVPIDYDQVLGQHWRASKNTIAFTFLPIIPPRARRPRRE